MRSLSEIDTLSKRASKGIGFSWGVSEEIGKCIKLMEMFGLPGLKNLNNYFKVIKKNQFQNISLITTLKLSKEASSRILAGLQRQIFQTKFLTVL